MRKVCMAAWGFAAVLASCTPTVKKEVAEDVKEIHVLHSEDVATLSPDSIISILKEGNQRFISNSPSSRDVMAQLVESAEDGQAPLAIILSCIDSRVPVELIFDKGLGDLFVTRIAGNVVSPDILGSMEYACEHAGSKVVVVLGHECCGAVHSACEGAAAGNMTQMLEKIKPAIESCSGSGEIAHTSEFENKVIYKNIENMVTRIRKESEILAHLEERGDIKIVGAFFNLHTGVVEFI
ncbi:MAG: carbonic anhydrase family protein [Phocaeicola sp.]